MPGKILVAYGSWCGSAAEVAREIGAILARGGLAVDILPAAEVANLGAYRAVVLRTAIRARRCKAEVTKFAQRHQTALRSPPYTIIQRRPADAAGHA